MKFLFIIFSLLIEFGCNVDEKTTVKHEFILPDGYRGVFKVIVDKQAGYTPNPIDGVIKITVPPSGIVVLKSTATLSEWHKVIAVYKGGSTLANGLGELPDSTSVAFFSLWTEADGSIYYMVGTTAEFNKLQKSSPWKADDFLQKIK